MRTCFAGCGDLLGSVSMWEECRARFTTHRRKSGSQITARAEREKEQKILYVA